MIRFLNREDQVLGGLLGIALGDAAGSVRIESRAEVGMDFPELANPARWSEPTTQAMISAEALTARSGLAGEWFSRLRRYLSEGYWSGNNRGFRLEKASRDALLAYERGQSSTRLGNQNSILESAMPLVRALVAGLAHPARPVEALRAALDLAALTEGGSECRVSCAYLAVVVSGAASGEHRKALVEFPYSPWKDFWKEAAEAKRCQEGEPTEPFLETLQEAFSSKASPASRSRPSRMVAATLEALVRGLGAKGIIAFALRQNRSPLSGALAGGLAGALYGARGLPQDLVQRLVYLNSLRSVAGGLKIH